MHKRLIPLAYIFKKTISAFLPLADLGMAVHFLLTNVNVFTRPFNIKAKKRYIQLNHHT